MAPARARAGRFRIGRGGQPHRQRTALDIQSRVGQGAEHVIRFAGDRREFHLFGIGDRNVKKSGCKQLEGEARSQRDWTGLDDRREARGGLAFSDVIAVSRDREVGPRALRARRNSIEVHRGLAGWSRFQWMNRGRRATHEENDQDCRSHHQPVSM